MLAKRSLINCLASLSLAVAALTSCGSGTGDSIAFDDLESEALAATCRLSVACGTFPDEATCHASVSSTDGFFPTMRVDIASGRVIYDGAKARQCLDLFDDVRPCTFSAVSALATGIDAFCAETFTGTGAPGTACFFDEECANRGVCEHTTTCTLACCPGTCLARPTPIPVGGSCSGAPPYQGCADGSVCTFDGTGTTATCRAQTAGVGASCSTATGAACLASLYCDEPETDPSAAVCAQRGRQGEACNPTDPTSCDDVHDRCGDDNTCQPLIPVGGACSGTSLGCVSYARCDGTTCVALGKVGEPCEPGSFGQCLGTLDCDSTGRCAKPAAGGACR